MPAAIIKHAGKSDKKEKKHESIWLRLVGGVVGVVSMCVIFFALAIPVFGVINKIRKINTKIKY